MRLFVAVSLDDAVRSAAAACAEQLKRRLPAGCEARWVPSANMHLTVRFVGYVPDDRIPALFEVLRPPLSIPPFDVQLGACGVFPASGPPRAIWIGIDEGFETLHAMHDECSRRLEPLGFMAENRPFSGHLTLARVRDVPQGASRAIREAVRSVHSEPAPARVRAATLYESVLSPKGPTYRRLFDVPCIG
jgi:2'-5' RNA ligase